MRALSRFPRVVVAFPVADRFNKMAWYNRIETKPGTCPLLSVDGHVSWLLARGLLSLAASIAGSLFAELGAFLVQN